MEYLLINEDFKEKKLGVILFQRQLKKYARRFRSGYLFIIRERYFLPF